MPPAEPAIPPIPTNDATARLGNMSEVVVNRLADHAWCAAPAMPISNTAVHGSTRVAKKIGNTQHAKTNMPVLRARLLLQPRLDRLPVNQLPAMLSTVMIA